MQVTRSPARRSLKDVLERKELACISIPPRLILIGFKSVFSVASKVSIFSNGFNFCWDKSRPLGMINPILLDSPPAKARKGWTVFILGLSVCDNDYEMVKKALKEIRPEMLLFTRRLRRLEIQFISDAVVEKNVYSIAAEIDGHSSVCAINSTLADTRKLNYFRQEYDVSDMPDHVKRQDTSESKIVLAFPFDENGPIIGEQHIFAFMPLHRTPFPVPPFVVVSHRFSFSSRVTFLPKQAAKGFANMTLGISNYAMSLPFAS